MINKIKKFLREIFAPKVYVHHYSKRIKSEDWEAVRKDFEKVFEDMDEVFKNMDKLIKKL